MFYAELDKKEKTIKLKGDPDANFLLLTFLIIGNKGEKVDLKDMRFGYQLKSGNDVLLEQEWPPRGIRFAEHDPVAITVVNEKIKLSTDYQLLVWYSEGDYRAADTVFFNSGMPPKEYDSMVWDEETEQWDYLKPYPEVKEDEIVRYFWNEEILDWEEDVEYREFYSDPKNRIGELEPSETGVSTEGGIYTTAFEEYIVDNADSD